MGKPIAQARQDAFDQGEKAYAAYPFEIKNVLEFCDLANVDLAYDERMDAETMLHDTLGWIYQYFQKLLDSDDNKSWDDTRTRMLQSGCITGEEAALLHQLNSMDNSCPHVWLGDSWQSASAAFAI